MRILFLSPRQAWPLNSGAKLRDYYFARALGQQADLTYVFFSEPGIEFDASTLAFARHVQCVPKPKSYTPGKISRGIFGRWPVSVENYTSKEMKSTLRAISRQGHFDLIHLDAHHLAGYTPMFEQAFPGTPVVFNWHNIESELMDRFATNTTSAAKRLYARMTARRLHALERSILRSAYGHIVCSRRERDQLIEIAPAARIEVIDNGVDTQFFKGVKAASSPKRLLFVGSMSYHANIDAAVWFANAIWPKLRARFPWMTLTLAGYKPAPAVLALARSPGVEVTGTVDDVRPYYSNAVAAIAPLRTAGGTRLKILEAMAAGVPVISTATGAEGLDVDPGRHLLIADANDDWIAMTEQVLDPAVRSTLVAAGGDLVRSRYDWSALGLQLCRTYEEWLSAQR